MVASYYIIKPVYCLIWRIFKALRRNRVVVLYCDDAYDATLFKNVQKHLPPIPIVAKNRTVAAALNMDGYQCMLMPSFPDAVIMFRNMAWKFPCKRIIKIGFEHGPYHFKKFSNAQYYNMFNVFFMTSVSDEKMVRSSGAISVKSIGYPKIDSAFDGSISPETIHTLSTSLRLDPNKKTLLFSATWDGSGMSAINKWHNRISELVPLYNILVTLHPWVSKQYADKIKSTQSIVFIEDRNMLPYIKLANICISDTTSLISEFCLMDKPIITFRVPSTPRSMPDVVDLIARISLQINTFDELPNLIRSVLKGEDSTTSARREAVNLFFDHPDGNAGKRAANEILKLLPGL